MIGIDTKEARAHLDAAWADYDANPVRAGNLARYHARRALDEIDAMLAAPTAYDFDVKAARETMARIDAAWERAAYRHEAESVYADARALLHKALAAIDAGWPEPAGDVVERAAEAALAAAGGADSLSTRCSSTREYWTNVARAVLRSAGRLPEPVTDAMVEEAAAVLRGHKQGILRLVDARASWEHADDETQRINVGQARAVLEYAAARGVAPAPVAETSRVYRQAEPDPRLLVLATCAELGWTEAQTIEQLAAFTIGTLDGCARMAELTKRNMADPRVDTGAAERLTRYRCAAVHFIDRGHDMTLEQTSDIVERYAHAMLAAERTTDGR